MPDASTPRAYFRRLSGERFEATAHVGGAWATTEQHVSPALGLLAHVVEVDRDTRRDDQLPLARLSYDIFGAIPSTSWTSRSRSCAPGGPSNSSRRGSATRAASPSCFARG